MSEKVDKLRLLFTVEHDLTDALNSIRLTIDYDLANGDDIDQVIKTMIYKVENIEHALSALSQELRLTQTK